MATSDQQLAADCYEAFGTGVGLKVYEALMRKFPPDGSRFVDRDSYNAYAAAKRDGKSEVTAWIRGRVETGRKLSRAG